jgi:hypothetical protein
VYIAAVAIHTDDKNHHASHAIYNYTLETWDIIRKTKKGLGAVPVSCAGGGKQIEGDWPLKLNNNKVTECTVKNFERKKIIKILTNSSNLCQFRVFLMSRITFIINTFSYII